MSVPLVVLAGGLSTRYGRLKQLDPLGPGGETILSYNVYDAARAGFDRLVVVTRKEIVDALREHIGGIVGDALPIEYALQSLDHLPPGFRAPLDRAKPWGTGHAVLCARDHVDGVFAVCNSDDLYGPGAFDTLYRFLSTDPLPTDGALVGYSLDDTLSGHGGVARGVCVLKQDDRLLRVSEVRQIRRIDGWITGVTLEGEPLELTGAEVVSMNLWGFTQPVLEHMERQFERFLATWGSDWRQEFLLSMAINGQIQIGSVEITVLNAADDWFGITHAADRDRALTTLQERIAAGAYPDRLADGFASLS